MGSGRFSRALMILDECIQIKDSGLVRCIAANISLFRLHDPLKALSYLEDELSKMVSV